MAWFSCLFTKMNNLNNFKMAIAKLYDRYAGAIFKLCYSITHDKTLAEQALLKTFTRIQTADGVPQFADLFRQAREESLRLVPNGNNVSLSDHSPLERVVIEMVKVEGCSVEQTACMLHRDPSEIDRVLSRVNGSGPVNKPTLLT